MGRLLPAVALALTLAGTAGCRGGGDEDATTTTAAPSSSTTSTTIDPAKPRTATGANGNPRDERIGPPASNRPSDHTVGEGQCFNEVLEVQAPEAAAGATTSSVPVDQLPLVHRTTIVDCAQPHDGEVFAVVTLTGAEGDRFPGEAEAQTAAEKECLDRFAPFVGLEYATSSLRISVMRPTETTWADGDRLAVCSLYDERLRPLQGSARLSGR